MQEARSAHDSLPEHLACYVYGVVAGDADVPGGLTGLDDGEVELVRHGDVAAVVTVIEVERPPGRRKDLLAHSTVLDALAGAGPVVPVQFGSVLPDPASVVEDFLAPDADRFAELLEQLTGRSQFNLRATYNEAAVLAEVVAEQPEVAHLRQITRDVPEEVAYGDRVRLGELVASALEAKREYDAGILLDAVLPHVVDHSVRNGAGVDHLLDVAFLVDDEQRDAFEDALESLAEAMHERARLQLFGPLAPYDFVEG
ncbi:MAG: GvpL/GvpF family gas vesicle protein [Myxococcaceae bacterium]